jgi:hypothetical protein
MIQGGLQALLYQKSDMHTLTLKIEEYMEFKLGLNVKQIAY